MSSYLISTRLGPLHVLAVTCQMIPPSLMERRLPTLFASRGTEAVVLLLLRLAVLPTNAPVALVRTALELALASHQASLALHPNGQLIRLLLAPTASPGAK